MNPYPQQVPDDTPWKRRTAFVFVILSFLLAAWTFFPAIVLGGGSPILLIGTFIPFALSLYWYYRTTAAIREALSKQDVLIRSILILITGIVLVGIFLSALQMFPGQPNSLLNL